MRKYIINHKIFFIFFIIFICVIGITVATRSLLLISYPSPYRRNYPTSPLTPCEMPRDWEIRYSEVGGIVGMDLLLTIDSKGQVTVGSSMRPETKTRTTSISNSELITIAKLLSDACPFTIIGSEKKKNYPDRLFIEITVSMNGQIYRIGADDIPGKEIEPLGNYLNSLVQRTESDIPKLRN